MPSATPRVAQEDDPVTTATSIKEVLRFFVKQDRMKTETLSTWPSSQGVLRTMERSFVPIDAHKPSPLSGAPKAGDAGRSGGVANWSFSGSSSTMHPTTLSWEGTPLATSCEPDPSTHDRLGCCSFSGSSVLQGDAVLAPDGGRPESGGGQLEPICMVDFNGRHSHCHVGEPVTEAVDTQSLLQGSTFRQKALAHVSMQQGSAGRKKRRRARFARRTILETTLTAADMVLRTARGLLLLLSQATHKWKFNVHDRLQRLHSSSTMVPADSDVMNELSINMLRVQLCVPFYSLQEAGLKTHAPQGMTASRRRRLSMRTPNADDCSHDNLRERAKRRHRMEDGELLAIDRMLGTALIQAYLYSSTLLSPDQVQQQGIMQSQQPWEMPTQRSFGWYVSVFMVILKRVKSRGWLERGRLFQLAFLQNVEGSFEMSQALCNLIQIGQPLDRSEENPLPYFHLQNFQNSVPRALQEQAAREKLQAGEQAVDERASTETLWATLCAVALYNTILTSDWLDNPEDLEHEQQTLDEVAHGWLDKQFDLRPDLKPMRLFLEQQAQVLVQEGNRQRMEFIKALKARSDLRHGVRSAKYQTNVEKCLIFLHEIGLQLWTFAVHCVTSHPLVNVYLTNAAEPLTRAARFTLLVNQQMLMLLIAVGMYYSKALSCCSGLKDFVGCPDSSNEEPCIGFATCGRLADEGAELLPVEISATDYVCHAFPQSTLTGRMYATVSIVAIVLPLHVLISAVFSISSNPSIPRHLMVPRKGVKVERMFGPFMGTVVHAVLTLCYAIWVNFNKFNKTMALIFVGVINTVFKPVQVLLAACTKSLRAWHAIRGRMIRLHQVGRMQLEVERERERALFISPSSGNGMRLAYALVWCVWGTVAWVLIAKLKTLREAMGNTTDKTVLVAWGMALVWELFGQQGAYLILLKVTSTFIMSKLQWLAYTLPHAEASKLTFWYEQYVYKRFADRSEATRDLCEEELDDDGRDEFDDEGEGNDDANVDNSGFV
ncbi:hypothetical protein CYMTET_52335 [Cymbomonas tetramitiformis]|uniref:Uncharacterized protein n=1 Tax=Cymbomonas tetramitiformis TaxID=36881 RepID=A0AAE0BKX1_9CHLO|nr:hypothetical protein CYMTET_52335 [Cymbomonas tetramitiformis]